MAASTDDDDDDDDKFNCTKQWEGKPYFHPDPGAEQEQHEPFVGDHQRLIPLPEMPLATAPGVSDKRNLILLSTMMNKANHNDVSSHRLASRKAAPAPAPASTDSSINDSNANARTIPSAGRTSRSRPFPSSHVHRTQSELQLCEDEEMAERRDLAMFYRVVNGIRERQMHLVHKQHEQQQEGQQQQHQQHKQHKHNVAAVETQKSLAHIIDTRNSNPLDRPMFPLGYHHHHHYESNPDERVQHAFLNHRCAGFDDDSRNGGGGGGSHLSGVLYQAAKLASTSVPTTQQAQPNLDEDMTGDWSVSGFPEEEEQQQQQHHQQETPSKTIQNDHHYQEQGLFVDNSQPLPSTFYEKAADEDDECIEEEGIFDMDL